MKRVIFFSYLSDPLEGMYIDQYQSTDVERRHGPEKMLNEAEMIIVIQLLAARPSMYLDEIQEELYKMTGTYVHNSTAV